MLQLWNEALFEEFEFKTRHIRFIAFRIVAKEDIYIRFVSYSFF